MPVIQEADDETPLLIRQPKTTPIPLGPFLIVTLIQLAEPITLTVTYPFAPQLIRDIGITRGNEAQVGFYVGLLQSLFYVAEALTILHWSRTSDHIGRKPVVLFGLLGLSVSMCCLGLSKTYLALVLNRVLNGALNGNSGVMKCMMTELSDSTNIAQIYAVLPLAWATGGSIGPLVGGFLSRPVEQFPNLFGHSEFFREYPYFLSCATIATFIAAIWIVVYFFLKETLEHPIAPTEYFNIVGKNHSRLQSVTEPFLHERSVADKDKPVPLQQLLNRRVIVAGGSYAACSLLDIVFRAIQPVFLSTPITLGGLGLSPSVIGGILATYGIIDGVFQLIFFSKIHNSWGSKTTYIVGIICVFPMFLCFPFMSIVAKAHGLNLAVWGLVIIQNLAYVGLGLSFGASFVFVAASSPNKASLGATNGLSQMGVSLMRAIGPAVATSVFSLSIEKQYLGGHLVYYFLISLVFSALWVGSLLPWKP